MALLSYLSSVFVHEKLRSCDLDSAGEHAPKLVLPPPKRLLWPQMAAPIFTMLNTTSGKLLSQMKNHTSATLWLRQHNPLPTIANVFLTCLVSHASVASWSRTSGKSHEYIFRRVQVMQDA